MIAPLVSQGVYQGDYVALATLDRKVRVLMTDDTIQRIKVWRADGTILYCDDQREIGVHYTLAPDDMAVLTGGGTAADVSDLGRSENTLDRGLGESLEVYAGVRDGGGRPVLVETYFSTDQLHANEAALISRILPVVLAAVAGVGLMLVPLAFDLSRRIARHERERQSMLRLAADRSFAERRRVAGELHDGVIQDLAGVGYALSALDGQVAGLGPGAEPTAGAVRANLRRVQDLVHEDVLALRELTSLPYAAGAGADEPADALRLAADELRQAGMEVETAVAVPSGLSGAHRELLVRAGREALRNAAMHAPGSRVRMIVGRRGGALALIVTDDGPGFRAASAPGPLQGRMGLVLLGDAAERVGSRLDVRSAPGRGTTVRLLIPLPRRPSAGPLSASFRRLIPEWRRTPAE